MQRYPVPSPPKVVQVEPPLLTTTAPTPPASQTEKITTRSEAEGVEELLEVFCMPVYPPVKLMTE